MYGFILLFLSVDTFTDKAFAKPLVSISLWHSPIVLGSNIKLTCSVQNANICKNTTTRSWYRGKDNDLLLYNGFQRSNQFKYKEELADFCESFSLNIFNLSEHDINLDYKCTLTVGTSTASAQHHLELSNVSLNMDKSDLLHRSNKVILTCDVKGIFMCTNDSTRIWYRMKNGRQEYIKYNEIYTLVSPVYEELPYQGCGVFSLAIMIDFDVFENTEIGCTFSPDGIVFSTHKTILWGSKVYHVWCVYGSVILAVMTLIVNKCYFAYFYIKLKIKRGRSVICCFAIKTYISMVVCGMITSLLLKINTTTVDLPLLKTVRISQLTCRTAFTVIADFYMTFLCLFYTLLLEFGDASIIFRTGKSLMLRYIQICSIVTMAYAVFVMINDRELALLHLNEEIIIFLYSLLFFVSSCMCFHIVHSFATTFGKESSWLEERQLLLLNMSDEENDDESLTTLTNRQKLLLGICYEENKEESPTSTRNSMHTAADYSDNYVDFEITEMKTYFSESANDSQQSYVEIREPQNADDGTDEISESERNSLILDTDSSCYSTASEGLSAAEALV